jgi:hypothetical protein
MFDPDMKKLDPTVVAVSRLCCPTCWEFLQVLKNGDKIQENLWVHGHHSTLLPVELPDWLPANVLQEMVLRYRRHLSDKLGWFSRLKGLPGVKPCHGCRPSYSGATTSTRQSDEKLLGIAAGYITTLSGVRVDD